MVLTAGLVPVDADPPGFNPQHPVQTDEIVATIKSVCILFMRIGRESKATSSRRPAWAAEAVGAGTAAVAAACQSACWDGVGPREAGGSGPAYTRRT